MTFQESKAINSLRYICIVFLVMLHTRVTHLIDPSIKDSMGRIDDFINIPFLQILFLLSGYLFFIFKGDSWVWEVWKEKLHKRVKTLLVPYIIWCLMAIMYNYFILHKGLPDNVGTFLMQFWDAHAGHPIGKAMWYMKSLIVFSLLSPFYYYTIKLLKHSTLIIALLIIVCFDIPIDYPYFNVYLMLGAYISIMGYSFSDIVKNVDWRFCFAVYLLLKVLLLTGVFDLQVLLPMNLCCFIGLFMKYNVHPALASSSSFIYFVHPYVQGVRNIYIRFVDISSLASSFMVWMLTAITVMTICYGLFCFMKRSVPKVLSVLTGDRV